VIDSSVEPSSDQVISAVVRVEVEMSTWPFRHPGAEKGSRAIPNLDLIEEHAGFPGSVSIKQVKGVAVLESERALIEIGTEWVKVVMVQ